MRTKEINQSLYAHFINYNYRLFNSFIYGWESDFFAISKSGYSIEVEIKISHADFKSDYKKMTVNGNKHEVLTSKEFIEKPNKFYFACPENLIKPEDINASYGLIYIKPLGAKIVREAKFLHKEKILESKKFLLTLLNKFYHRNTELRHAQQKLDYDIKYGQRRLFEYDWF